MLLDRLERHEPHLEDGEPVEMIGHGRDAGRLSVAIGGPGDLVVIRDAARPSPEGDEMLADLVVGGQIARPDAVPEHGRRLAFRDIKFVRPGRVEPSGRRLLIGRRDRRIQSACGLQRDLGAEPVRRLRHPKSVAIPVMHVRKLRFVSVAAAGTGRPPLMLGISRANARSKRRRS